MKKVFTTGEVAKICQVAPRTVSKWFDSGQLRGYRLPGSLERRIPRTELQRFLRDSGMPASYLEGGDDGPSRVLLASADAFLADALSALLPPEDYCLVLAPTLFLAGAELASAFPAVLILDLALGRGECAACVPVAQLLAGPALPAPGPALFLAAVACEDQDSSGDFHAVYRRPFDCALLAEWVRRCSRAKHGGEACSRVAARPARGGTRNRS